MKTYGIFIVVLLFCAVRSFSQEETQCKVLMNEISGTYQGKCKNGLADGKGTAKGEDTYAGMFENGLPEGKGKYTYKNGNSFNGNWSKGLKNGVGKFTYFIDGKPNVLKGYWKNGEYAGITNPDDLYRVTNVSGIGNYSIKKVEGDGKKVKISFFAAMQQYVPRDVEIKISSGQLTQEIKDFCVNFYTCPVNCSIHFTIKKTSGNWQCNLMFDILQPGNYEVVINND